MELISARLARYHEFPSKQEAIISSIKVLAEESLYYIRTAHNNIEVSRYLSSGLGPDDIRWQDVDVTSVLTSAIKALSPTIKSRKLAIELSVGGRSKGPYIVRADQPLLWTAIYNLLENAVKFSSRETKIQLEIDDGAPSCWGFKMRNIGTLAHREYSGIFEPFTRATRRTEHRRRGDGMGLVVCAEILRAHDPKVVFDYSSHIDQADTRRAVTTFSFGMSKGLRES